MNANQEVDDTEIVYTVPSPTDAAAVGELFYEDMSDLGVHTSREEVDELAKRVIEACTGEQASCVCWVARPGEDAAPCGVVLANFHWSLKFAGRSLWIEELYVTPAFRRRGIGRALVERVLDYGESAGFAGVDLEAYQGNTPASVLYRTMGFHRLGRERFYYRFGSREFL